MLEDWVQNYYTVDNKGNVNWTIKVIYQREKASNKTIVLMEDAEIERLSKLLKSLTLKKVCALTGFSRPFLRKEIRQGFLRKTVWQRRFLIDEKDLETYLNNLEKRSPKMFKRYLTKGVKK